MKLELRHGFDFRFSDHKKASGFWNLFRKSVIWWIANNLIVIYQILWIALLFSPKWQLSTHSWQFVIFQGYEGSLLKVTSKNGKTASPVGFVTFASRASAEAAKQDLQVGRCCHTLPPPCHHCQHCLPPLALGRRHGSPGCHGYSPVWLPAGPQSPRCSRQQKAANQQRDHGPPANQRPGICCCEHYCYSGLIFPVTVPSN